MKHRTLFLSLLIWFVLITPPHHAPGEERSTESCKTRYPILLVHGLGLRDQNRAFPYWGKIPQVLARCGATVFLSHQNAFASHSENALSLRDKVVQILQQTGARRVNIIAHSKGGLEARYLISRLGMDRQVASLTTLATPHRGSYLADLVLSKVGKKDAAFVQVINFLSRLAGDKNPNSWLAGDNLTRDFMAAFNRKVPNRSRVYYQSYCAVIDSKFPNLLLRKMAQIIAAQEGANDSMVSLESCRWGNFRGVVKGERNDFVSHVDIVGLHQFSGVRDFDAAVFLQNIVAELKSKGY